MTKCSRDPGNAAQAVRHIVLVSVSEVLLQRLSEAAHGGSEIALALLHIAKIVQNGGSRKPVRQRPQQAQAFLIVVARPSKVSMMPG